MARAGLHAARTLFSNGRLLCRARWVDSDIRAHLRRRGSGRSPRGRAYKDRDYKQLRLTDRICAAAGTGTAILGISAQRCDPLAFRIPDQTGDTTMSQLVINDLPRNEELDRAARSAVFGGISFGWIQPYTKAAVMNAPSPMNFFNITSYHIDYDLIQQNPTNVYVDNSGGNSGMIVNNITAMPILAASPTLQGS